MAEHSKQDHSHGHKGLGLGSVGRVCKSFVFKCYSEQNAPPKTARSHDYTKPILFEKDKFGSNKIHDERPADQEYYPKQIPGWNGSTGGAGLWRTDPKTIFYTESPPASPGVMRSLSPNQGSTRNTSIQNLSKNGSKDRIENPNGATALNSSVSINSMNRRNTADAAVLRSFSRNRSIKRGSYPIMFSNSNGLMKPPPMERPLYCTLEELCFGCIKKIMIKRDVVTNNGCIIQEEEVLTVKVKPGWINGTSIKFEGMGNETEGTEPGDVILIITEKKHPLFRREGNDLELGVQIPLLQALTGCSISLPLLGGEKMSLTIDDEEIIYPGYQKIIKGQGMPKSKEEGSSRGNLVVTFLVVFPRELTDEQRSLAASVLKDVC